MKYTRPVPPNREQRSFIEAAGYDPYQYSVVEETEEVLTITDRMYQRDEIWINKRLARERMESNE